MLPVPLIRQLCFPMDKYLLLGALTLTELYDPATGTWSYTGSLNTGRYAHTATPLPDGKVLVGGGINNLLVLSSAEIYDPSNGTWSLTASMNSPRELDGAILLPNNRVL